MKKILITLGVLICSTIFLSSNTYATAVSIEGNRPLVEKSTRIHVEENIIYYSSDDVGQHLWGPAIAGPTSLLAAIIHTSFADAKIMEISKYIVSDMNIVEIGQFVKHAVAYGKGLAIGYVEKNGTKTPVLVLI